MTVYISDAQITNYTPLLFICELHTERQLDVEFSLTGLQAVQPMGVVAILRQAPDGNSILQTRGMDTEVPTVLLHDTAPIPLLTTSKPYYHLIRVPFFLYNSIVP